MARTFVAASSQSLTAASASVTAAPLTLACWYNPSSIAGTSTLMALDDTTTGNSFFLRSTAATGTLAAFTSSASSFGSSTTAGSLVVGTWAHCAGVYASATSRIAYLNGTAATTDATNLTPSGINRTTIGALAGIQFAAGNIAEAAIWNVALSAADITALAAGVSPLLVRPTSLIHYWPIYGQNSPETDVMVAAKNLTVNNAPAQSTHTRIYNACAPQKV